MDRTSARVTQLVPGVVAMALVGGSVPVSRTLVDAPLFTTQAVRYLLASVVLVSIARLAGVRSACAELGLDPPAVAELAALPDVPVDELSAVLRIWASRPDPVTAVACMLSNGSKCWSR